MKITLCGSSTFKEDMVYYKKRLNGMRHEAILHPHYEAFVKGEKQDLWKRVLKEHAAVKKEQNYIMWYYNAIKNSDAILVINMDKKGQRFYIGGNTLMEIAFAYVNKKKIFLINPIPEISYKDELLAMEPKVIFCDLSEIQ